MNARPRRSPAAVAAWIGGDVVLHGVIALAVVVTAVVYVPPFLRLFEDMAATLPWATRLAIAFAELVRNPLVAAPLLLFGGALDAAVFSALLLRAPIALAIAWLVGVGVALALAVVALVVAMQLPMFAAASALSG